MNNKSKENQNKEQFKTMIGGQALIEGIMMLGPDKSAVVVRTKDGLQEKIEERKKPSAGFSIKQLPFIRGLFNFWTSMKIGVSAMMYSADFMIEEETAEETENPSKLDKWLEEKLSTGAFTTLAVILGICLSVGLFVILPSFIGSFIERWIPNDLVHNLVEGLIRVVILVGYMFLISMMKDMKRVFAYHGAEHKTIRCYEAKLPLTVENVRQQSRLHPRCGTSFLFVVVFLSILVFSVASILLAPVTPTFDSTILNALVRVLLKLILLPVVVGIAYEINRFVGRFDNWFTRSISAPGMWLQYITTNEPDDSMIEVGIAALSAVIPEEEGSDRW
ncbi:MAG: DUF1385 domain-containing protein [Oscillospiraceae bacterium]|nr:DUF1385 domain-containing protein [Oscillospiraceae bacterium]